MTFRDVVARGRHEPRCHRGLDDAAGSVDRPRRELSQALGVDPGDTRRSASSRNSFPISLIRGGGMAGADRNSRYRLANPTRSIVPRSKPRAAPPARAHRQLSESVLHRRARAAQEYRHEEDRRQASAIGWLGCNPNRIACARYLRASARSLRVNAPARCVTIAADVIARYRREKDRRAPARLRRSDRQDARCCSRARPPPGCFTSSIAASTTC